MLVSSRFGTRTLSGDGSKRGISIKNVCKNVMTIGGGNLKPKFIGKSQGY